MTTMLIAGWLWTGLAGAPLPGLAGGRDPIAIVGGAAASTCAWPSVVAMLVHDQDGALDLTCSGALIGPSTVLTAAHCVRPERPIVAVAFGEQAPPAGAPARTVVVSECLIPDEAQPPGSVNTLHHDVAVCRLATPVLDVPRIPLATACELDAVVLGASATIVGFGATWANTVDDELETVGAGDKRTATQVIERIDDDDWHSVAMANLAGPTTCNGDSGGPAFVQLHDGSWRVFAVASGGYTPDGAGAPPDDNNCWAGGSYGFAALYLDWIESAAGEDLSPCHDAHGAWSPSVACPSTQVEPEATAGEWTRGCAAGASRELAPTCVAEAGDTSGAGSGEESGLPESTSGSSSSTDAVAADTTTDTPDDTTGAIDAPRTETSPPGCGCDVTAAPRLGWVLLIVATGVRSRRRPSP